MRKSAAILLFILLAASVAVIGQEKKDEAGNGVKTSIMRALTTSYSDLQPYKVFIYDSDGFSAVFKDIANRTALEITQQTLPIVNKFIISATLPDPHLLSPAYENVGIGPRTNLNIDIVTGKYYWEW